MTYARLRNFLGLEEKPLSNNQNNLPDNLNGCKELIQQPILLPDDKTASFSVCKDELYVTEVIYEGGSGSVPPTVVSYYPSEIQTVFDQQTCAPKIDVPLNDLNLNCIAIPTLGYCGSTLISAIFPFNNTCTNDFAISETIAGCFANVTQKACQILDSLNSTDNNINYLIGAGTGASLFLLCCCFFYYRNRKTSPAPPAPATESVLPVVRAESVSPPSHPTTTGDTLAAPLLSPTPVRRTFR